MPVKGIRISMKVRWRGKEVGPLKVGSDFYMKLLRLDEVGLNLPARRDAPERG